MKVEMGSGDVMEELRRNCRRRRTRATQCKEKIKIKIKINKKPNMN